MTTKIGNGPPAEVPNLSVLDFLEARIVEDELLADRSLQYGNKGAALLSFGSPDSPPTLVMHPTRVIAECKAKRDIIKQHELWPVLVEKAPEFANGSDIASMTMHISQQIAWLTEREYVKKFGEEPPTAPMIRTLAAIYDDHPDYRPEWANHG